MQEFKIVQEFFSGLRCTQCLINFSPESVSIVRSESNCTVVRISCSHCGKNIGMAILGVDRSDMKNAMELDNSSEEQPINSNQHRDPISYNDVINAHNFFNNLGSDWAKYLPKN